jgi:hypothetical protein
VRSTGIEVSIEGYNSDAEVLQQTMVRCGEHQRAVRALDTVNFGERGLHVKQVLQDLGTPDGVKGLMFER